MMIEFRAEGTWKKCVFSIHIDISVVGGLYFSPLKHNIISIIEVLHSTASKGSMPFTV
jgi:hypothetical protein